MSRIHADIGDQVRAGQLLAEIDVSELLYRELQQAQAARAQAKANLELARVTAGRYAALIAEDAVSPQEADEKRGLHDARRADLEAVEANLRRLEQLKAYQRVVAPFAGTVTERNVDVGMLIQAGSASASGWLYKLSQTGTLRVHVNVPQNQLKMVQPGMSADLYIPGLSDQAFPAKVARVSGAFDNASRTMLVELHVFNPDGRILPGMYGQVRFRLVNPTPNLIIPVTALMVTGDGLRVATVDAQDAVHIATVEVGRDHGKQVEILKGLSDNQRVINNPRDTLTEGVKVRPVPQEEDSAKAASPGTALPSAAPQGLRHQPLPPGPRKPRRRAEPPMLASPPQGWLAVGVAAMAAGCAGHPGPPPGQDAKLPAAFVETGPWKQTPAPAAIARGDWWKVFGDPVLEALEDQATANSPRLRAAAARVEQARAVAGIVEAGRYPNVGVNVDAARYEASGNRPDQPEQSPGQRRLRQRTYSACPCMPPMRSTCGAASHARSRPPMHAQKPARLPIRLCCSRCTGKWRRPYFALRVTERELAIVEHNLELRERARQVVLARRREGLASELDVARIEADVANTQGRKGGGRSPSRRTWSYTLAVLVGTRCRKEFRINSKPDPIFPAPAIPVGLPSELLERRPDVAEAKQQLIARHAEVGRSASCVLPFDSPHGRDRIRERGLERPDQQ